MRLRLLLSAGLAIAGGLPPLGAPAALADTAELLRHGRIIVETYCARCHSVGHTGRSAHPAAPTFPEIADRYPPEHLAEAFAEGIVVGHPDMPVFRFEPGEIDAILAYLESVAPARRTSY
jgi:mono/diheme cytochrome c family protein